MVKLLLVIGTGSFVGGISRFLVSRLIQNTVLSAFPYGTLVVNVLGCLLIGLLYGISERGGLLSPEWRMFLTVGFCGSFTTFSTFAHENFSLLRDGSFFHFAVYISLSLVLGFIAIYLGNLITKMF